MANAEALRQHVLDNLNRVLPMASSSAFLRYQLDRIECTSQITELAARKLIVRYSDGRLKRSTANNAANIGVGVRQLPTAEALDLVQALFSAPPSIHKDPQSASARAAQISGRTSAKEPARKGG